MVHDIIRGAKLPRAIRLLTIVLRVARWHLRDKLKWFVGPVSPDAVTLSLAFFLRGFYTMARFGTSEG